MPCLAGFSASLSGEAAARYRKAAKIAAQWAF
jgi:hypothetical protein